MSGMCVFLFLCMCGVMCLVVFCFLSLCVSVVFHVYVCELLREPFSKCSSNRWSCVILMFMHVCFCCWLCFLVLGIRNYFRAFLADFDLVS